MAGVDPRVSLRSIIGTDLPTLYEHQCDAEACQVADFQARNRDAFLAHWAGILSDVRVIARAIISDAELTGHICSFDAHGRREIGYWIGRPFWGRGIATAAVAQFLCVEPFRPLYAYIAVGNIASIRVLEKCGFALSRKTENSRSKSREWYEAVRTD